MKKFILTKKIAKHGSQNIIILPTFLKDSLKPKTLVRVTIDVIDDHDSKIHEDIKENPKENITITKNIVRDNSDTDILIGDVQ